MECCAFWQSSTGRRGGTAVVFHTYTDTLELRRVAVGVDMVMASCNSRLQLYCVLCTAVTKVVSKDYSCYIHVAAVLH